MKNKDKVYESYEKIADWFDENRSRDLFKKPYLDKAIAHLKLGAKILDLGCGMGEPIAGYFIEKGFLLFTSGPDESEVWGNNGGEDLYHASLSTAEYQSLLKQHHFEVMIHSIEDEACGDATIWMARYER